MFQLRWYFGYFFGMCLQPKTVPFYGLLNFVQLWQIQAVRTYEYEFLVLVQNTYQTVSLAFPVLEGGFGNQLDQKKMQGFRIIMNGDDIMGTAVRFNFFTLSSLYERSGVSLCGHWEI